MPAVAVTGWTSSSCAWTSPLGLVWNLGAVVDLELMEYWPEVEPEPVVGVELGLEVLPEVEVAPESESEQLAEVEPAVEAVVKEPVVAEDPVGPEEKAGLVVEAVVKEPVVAEDLVGPEVEVDLQVQVALEEMGLECPVGDYSCATRFLCQKLRL